MGTMKSSNPRTGPQCTEINGFGFRCGHNAIEGLNKCQFHSTERERSEAKILRKQTIAAAREAAREAALNRQPSPSSKAALDFLESTDNAQDFAKALLTSLEFCEYIAEGLRTRTIPPNILLRLMDYAEGWGKPPDRIEHTGKDGEPVVSEIRRIIVHPRDETEETPIQPEDLDIPLIPVEPKRMH